MTHPKQIFPNFLGFCFRDLPISVNEFHEFHNLITRFSSDTNLESLFTTIDTNADGLGTAAENTIFTEDTLQETTRAASDTNIDYVRTIAEPKTLYAHIVADYFETYASTIDPALQPEEIEAINIAISTIPNLEFGNPADAVGIHIKAAMIKPADYVNSATQAQFVQEMMES